MGKKLIMIIAGVIIVALVVGVVMIQGSNQNKIKLLEDEKSQLNQSSQSKIKLLEDEKGKVSSQYETVLSNLQKSQVSLNEAINIVNSEALKQQIPLIPESTVIEKCINQEEMSKMLASATYTVTYSIGQKKARQGKIIILGKEGDKYVGFTTRCAVSLDRPYRGLEDEATKDNELIIITDRQGNPEWYKVKGSIISPGEQIGAVNCDPSFVGDELQIEVVVDAKKSWHNGTDDDKPIKISRGEKIRIKYNPKKPWNAGNRWNGGEYSCGPEGTDGGAPPYSAKIGALMVGIRDDQGKLYEANIFTVAQKDKSEFEREAYISGTLSFCINDNPNKLGDNSGEQNITILKVKRPISDILNDVKKSSEEVEIEKPGDDDVALVYFPISENNLFGNRNNPIHSLGLEHPKKEAMDAIKNSTIFGIKFVRYCEHCHKEIQQFPEKLRQAFEEGRKIGIEEGKILGKKELVGNFIRTGVNLLCSIITCGVINVLPLEYRDIGNAVGQKIVASFLDNVWFNGGKDYIEKAVPLLKDTLPESISEFFPEVASAEEFGKSTDRHKKLAGIELAGDTDVTNRFITTLIEKAEKVMWIPANKQDGYQLIDGQFVNQLLVNLGMAKVSSGKGSEGLPFYKEMKQSQQKAKENKIGIWAK